MMHSEKVKFFLVLFLFFLVMGIEAASAEQSSMELASQKPESSLLGYGEKDLKDGYIVKPLQTMEGIPKQSSNGFSYNIPLNEERITLSPLLQRSLRAPRFWEEYQQDFNLLNNGYGLEYGMSVGYTLSPKEFYNLGEMKFSLSLMPKLASDDPYLFPDSKGLSKVELGIGYRPVSNAEVFLKFLTLKDLIQQQDLFKSLANAIEIGAQVTF